MRCLLLALVDLVFEGLGGLELHNLGRRNVYFGPGARVDALSLLALGHLECAKSGEGDLLALLELPLHLVQDGAQGSLAVSSRHVGLFGHLRYEFVFRWHGTTKGGRGLQV